MLQLLFYVSDKLKRTALVHAVKSGHTNVASYLIALGASTEIADTSGVTIEQH